MRSSTLALVGLLLLLASRALAEPLPLLKVSDNKRHLVTADGKPFFYLGDTAWELFHRLNREDAEHYLKDRAGRRFTVIQAVVLGEFEGLKKGNAYGVTPLIDLDPTQPREAYFSHVDWIVEKANSLGLVIGMLPTWGDKVNRAWGEGPEIFTPENAEVYGDFLGKRYKDRGIIWILGGDRNPDKPQHTLIWRALAKGLRKGDDGRHLITYHPSGGRSSAEWFHDEPWLDFNMMQNGHGVGAPIWERMTRDYDRKPPKPVLDGEPLYEDHPIGFKAREQGYSSAADIRRFAYWDLFAGAFGHTYGNHAVWQFFSPANPPINGPLKPWKEALAAPGATQMQHVRALIESRPMLSRIPDQTLLVSDPAGGLKRLQSCRGEDGSYAFVYLPSSRPVEVNLEKLTGEKVIAWWFDPRTGKAEKIGEQVRQGKAKFTPPQEGENLDWVLVLDDAARKFPPPGSR
jgi:hypothetical protein